MANDTDVVQDYDLWARNASGATVALGRLTLQPRTNVARFADEVMPPPNTGDLVIYISVAGSSPTPSAAFNTIGLSFSGNLFTTLPAFSAP